MVNSSPASTNTPSPANIRRLLYDYGLRRWRAAELLGCALVTFHRYCLPVTSKHHHPMPQRRWERLLAAIQAHGRFRDKRGSWRRLGATRV